MHPVTLNNHGMQQLWQEVFADITTDAGAWQLLCIACACLAAWLLSQGLSAYLLKRAQRLVGGGPAADTATHIMRTVLFPLTALLIVSLAKTYLFAAHHHGLLKIAQNLLLALVAIRLAAHVLRYVFSPSGWVRKTESAIASTIWTMLALHLSGLLPNLIAVLEDVSFTIGKTKLSLWFVIQAAIIVVLTVIFALWLSRMVENKLLRTEYLNPNMRVVLGKLLRIVFTVFAVLFSFSAIGLDITLLSVFGGALGVGLGFGLQKIASNFVSGFILLLDHSLRMGDVITVEGHYGVVTDLRARYLVLEKLDGTKVVIPNETLITNPVINHSYTDRKARVQLPVTVGYDSQVELAMQLMQESATQHARVMQTPAPQVLVKGFGENGIELTLNVWIPDPEEGSAQLQSELYLAIWQTFKAHGVTIPYPQREIKILQE